jgi:hypothetical protein
MDSKLQGWNFGEKFPIITPPKKKKKNPKFDS